jgi:SNF2 family DNA or RNA helicase
VLSAFGQTAALVQLERLGFPEFEFTEQRKWQLAHWYGVQAEVSGAERLAERGGPGTALAPRMRGLWDDLEGRRLQMRQACDEMGDRLSKVLPSGLALDEHQLQAVVLFERWKRRMLLADDMGLGKTITTLGCIALEQTLPVFVACPASMVYTWIREADKWLEKLGPECHPITRGFKADQVENPERAFIVGSYEQMIGYQREIMLLRPRFFISDESHYLMRWESQRTRTAIRIRSKASHRLLLSGTPMPNGRHREIYPQVKILDGEAFAHLARGKKTDRYTYLRRYCDPQVQHFGKKSITKFDGRSNEVELGRTLQGFMLRRTKDEAGLNLPDKVRNALEVPLPMRQQLKLAKMKDDIARRIRDKAAKVQEELELKGYSIEQASDKAKEVLASQTVTELAEMHAALGVIKTDWSVRRVREHLDAGHRVLVFAYHHKVAHHAEKVYGKAFGAERVRMATGAIAGTARQRFVDRIEPPDGSRGEGDIVILTRAFREGLTLTSFTRGVMLQRWWVPGEESQAEDRIHRRGQTKDVAWDYLIVSGSLDDAMAELITWKERGQQQSYGSMELRVLQWLVPELAA